MIVLRNLIFIKIFIPLLFFASAFNNPLWSQYRKDTVFNVSATHFTTDCLANIFFIENQELVRINPFSGVRRTFKLSPHGKQLYYDVSNPYYIALVFTDTRKVLLLDTILTPSVHPFYLEEAGLYDISAIVASGSRELWFYNFINQYFIKLNPGFLPVIKTETLFKLSGIQSNPNYFCSHRENLFISLPASGVLVLDRNGTYKTFYNIPGITDFQVRNGYIFYYRDKLIYRFDMMKREAFKIEIPDLDNIINAHYHSDRLVIQTPDSVLVYSK